eukprot:1179205-Prorocentrum_minimum.AAC.3
MIAQITYLGGDHRAHSSPLRHPRLHHGSEASLGHAQGVRRTQGHLASSARHCRPPSAHRGGGNMRVRHGGHRDRRRHDGSTIGLRMRRDEKRDRKRRATQSRLLWIELPFRIRHWEPFFRTRKVSRVPHFTFRSPP